MVMTYPSNKVCPRCGARGHVWYLDNSEYVAKCTNCGHYFRREDFPMCVLDRAKKAITNADRIRAMSDEELAEQLYLLRLDALRLEGFEGFIETKGEVLDWLKEEWE